MSKQQYSGFHSFMQKIAASQPGSWFFARTEHHLDRITLKLTNGRTTLTSILSGLPVVMLSTTGAKSGLTRTVPLLCIRDSSNPNVLALIASNFGQQHNPAWYYNLKANDHATCTINGQAKEYLAHEVVEEEYDKFWQHAMDMYVGYSGYKLRASNRHIPIMVMIPTD